MFRKISLDLLGKDVALDDDFTQDILGLTLAENIGPLVVLESFLIVGNKIFQVSEAKQLPEIKEDIRKLHEQVRILSETDGVPAMFSDDALNLLLCQLALYLYYRKCIDLKVPLYQDEIQECANVKQALFNNAPSPHFSFTHMTNLIFSIVLVTKEIIELPKSLDNIEYAKIQEHLMAIQVILLIAAQTAKKSREQNYIDDEVRSGLSCMLSGCASTGSPMDEYAKALAKLAYSRVAVWCESIKKRKEGREMQGMDSLYHYEEALVTLCGLLNYAEDTEFQKQVAEQRKKFLPFDESNPVECEAFYLGLLVKSNTRCERLEKIMHAIIHNRAIDAEGAMTWQRIATNALNIYYTELLAARIHLQSGAAKFSSPGITALVERGLTALSLICSTAVVDAIPRREVMLSVFNRLWLVLEVAREPTDAEFVQIIKFGAASNVMATLVSSWLVSKVTCHLSADKPEFKANRKSLFDSLLYRLNCILKIAEDCDDEKSKKNINQIAIDLYFYLLKFSSSPEENSIVMTDEMQKKIACVVQKSVHAKKYQFLFETMSVLKSSLKTASDLSREYVAALEKRDPKKYKALYKAAKDAFRDLDFYDKHRMNYHIHVDFIMFGTIFFAKSPRGNCVNGVKLAFYRNDLSSCSIRLIKEMGIEAMAMCGAKMEMVEALPQPKAAEEPKKQIIDPEQRKLKSASFLPAVGPRKPAAAKAPRSKKSGNRQPQVTAARSVVPMPPKVSAGFSALEKFYDEDYEAIAAYLQQQIALTNVSEVDKYSAIVKLTHCLEKLKDPVLMTYIQTNADKIFQDARKFYTDRTDLNEDRAYVYGVLAKLELDDRSEKSDTCSSHSLTESTEDDTEELDLSQMRPLVTTVVSTMYAQPDSNKQTRRHQTLNFQQIIDKYKPHEQTQPVQFPFTPGQWAILQCLKDCAHRTFVHGSSIISLLKGAAVTDIDLLCYVDAIQLQQYFSDHLDELGITWSSIDMNNKEILHVYLKELKKNGDPVKLEFACCGKLSDAEMLADMRKRLRSYYLSNMLADPHSGHFIDLYRQYVWLVERNKITSVVRDQTAVAKFEESPMRIIDLIIRLAYFKSQDKPFRTTYGLRAGVIINADRLEFNEAWPDRTINTNKWEKLFVRGHAKQSFDELMFFDLFRVLFPAFDKMNSEQMLVVGETFAEFDRYIKQKYKYELTNEQNGKECLELLKRLAICYLDIHKIKTSLCRNKNTDALREKIKFILTGINLMCMDRLIPSVQSLVIKRLFKLDQKPKRKAVSELFIPPAQDNTNQTQELVKMGMK